VTASARRAARLLLLLLLHLAWGRPACSLLLLRRPALLLLLLCVQLLQQALALHVQLLLRQLHHTSSCALVQRTCDVRAVVLRELPACCCDWGAPDCCQLLSQHCTDAARLLRQQVVD
jgi:hypothetical protein